MNITLFMVHVNQNQLVHSEIKMKILKFYQKKFKVLEKLLMITNSI